MQLLQLPLLMCLSAIITATHVEEKWMYPPLCEEKNEPCDYIVYWSIDVKVVNFTIKAKQTKDTWIGLGFAKDKEMTEKGEFLYAYHNSENKGVAFDGSILSLDSAPSKDIDQNLIDPRVTYEYGYLTAKFSHHRISQGSCEFNFTDGDCYYAIFSVGGGKYLDDNGLVDKHIMTPNISDIMYCFDHKPVQSTVSLISLVSESMTTEPIDLHTPIVEDSSTTVLPENIEKLTTVTVPSMSSESSHLVTLEDVSTSMKPEVTLLEDFTKSTLSHETKLSEIISTTKQPCHITNKDYKKVCYYSNLSQHRPGKAKFLPKDIDVNLCSHLVFSFACIEDNKLVPTEANDATPGGLYKQFNDLKQNSNVKTLLAVGGCKCGTTNMTAMLKTKENRKVFIKSVMELLRKFGFDGCVLHFEHPGSNGSPPEDKEHFTSLVQEMKIAFKEEVKYSGKLPLLLVTAIPPIKDIIDMGYDLKSFSKDLDIILLTAYDFVLGENTVTGHHSPLFPGENLSPAEAQKNVDWAAKYLESLDAPKEKLIIGIPTYGWGFLLKDPNQHGLGAPALGVIPPGPYTEEEGIMPYYEICELLAGYKVTRVWLEHEKVPYIYNSTIWVGYEDQQSLIEKINWLKNSCYGGYMVYTLDFDDFKGEFCNKGSYPLIRTLYDNLIGYLPTATP